jgi:hypothetical protein
MLSHANCHRAPPTSHQENQDQPLHPFVFNDLMMPPSMTRATHRSRWSVVWMDQQLRQRRERAAYQLAQPTCIRPNDSPESRRVPYLPEGLDRKIKSYVVSPRNLRRWNSLSLQILPQSTRVPNASMTMPSRNHHPFGASAMTNIPVALAQNEQPTLPASHHATTGIQHTPSQTTSAMDHLNIVSYMGDRTDQEHGRTPIKLRPRKKARHWQTLEADDCYFIDSVSEVSLVSRIASISSGHA